MAEPRVSDLEDGASEVVDRAPRRTPVRTASLEEVVESPAGGSLARMRELGDRGRREFVLLRSPLGVLRLPYTQMGVLHAVWQVCTAKRVQGEADHGATAAEIAEAAGTSPSSARSVLSSLLRSRAIRSTVTHVGWRGTRARYYPTATGQKLLAFAAELPLGASVQVGRTNKSWRSRGSDEPANLFQFASLLRGGGDISSPDTEFA